MDLIINLIAGEQVISNLDGMLLNVVTLSVVGIFFIYTKMIKKTSY